MSTNKNETEESLSDGKSTKDECESATELTELGESPVTSSSSLKIVPVAGGSNEPTIFRVKTEEVLYVSPLDRNIWVFFGGLIVIVVASLFTRFYNISLPRHIA